VKGLKNLRIGAIGARPTAFNTVRYSERILETSGITIETLDLSEVFGRINKMKDNDDAAQAKLAAIKSYVTTAGIPDAALLKMAKLGAVIDGWMKQTHVTISAVQCWTSMEEYFGVVPCTIMSMMSEQPDSFGLRSGRARHAEHVHAGAGLGHAFGAAGLE
jgi:L-fucose isomerase-like protein